jgi:hypothetical protein
LPKEADRPRHLPDKSKLGSECILRNVYGVMVLMVQGMALEQTVYGQGHEISTLERSKSVILLAGNCH